MTEQPEVSASPVVKVARDLTEIERLAEALEAEAVASSTDRLMPGGKAMVALGPVASLEAWENRYEAAERFGRDTSYVNDGDDEWEPPLQSLLFWTEAWRTEHGMDYGQRPTIATEAAFLRHMLDWAWDHEPRFDDLAADIRRARLRLEDVVNEGRRSQLGVRCFDCNVDLIRPRRDRRTIRHCEGHDGVCTIPHARCPHDRGGLADEWVCPSCERRYDVETYRRAVSYAHFVHADYLTLAECIDRTGVPRGSIQGWASKGLVRKQRDLNSGRMTYSVRDLLRLADGGLQDQVSAV